MSDFEQYLSRARAAILPTDLYTSMQRERDAFLSMNALGRRRKITVEPFVSDLGSRLQELVQIAGAPLTSKDTVNIIFSFPGRWTYPRLLLSWRTEDSEAIAKIAMYPHWAEYTTWHHHDETSEIGIEAQTNKGHVVSTSADANSSEVEMERSARARLLWEWGYDSRLRERHIELVEQVIAIVKQPVPPESSS